MVAGHLQVVPDQTPNSKYSTVILSQDILSTYEMDRPPDVWCSFWTTVDELHKHISVCFILTLEVAWCWALRAWGCFYCGGGGDGNVPLMLLCSWALLFVVVVHWADLSLFAFTRTGASVKTQGRFPELLECVFVFLILSERSRFHRLVEVKPSQQKSQESIQVWICVLLTIQHWNVTL